MTLLGIWNTRFTMRYVPLTLVQVVFSAGTVFLLSVEHAATSRPTNLSVQDSYAQLDLCMEYLSQSGKSFSGARQVRDILKKLRQTQFNRLNEQSSESQHETPASSSSSSTILQPPFWDPSSVPSPVRNAFPGYIP